jgi:hypothetical protein
MVATLEYYVSVAEAFYDTESLTVLVVAGRSRDQVARTLGVDLGTPTGDPWAGDKSTGWALMNLPSGVLAIEPTGYGDPTNAALVELSSDGGAAAVTRSNIQAHHRFGCARDGELLYDNDEYVYEENLEVVPAEIRSLFDLAWVDLDAEDDDEDDDGDWTDPLAVGLAMAEVVTGIERTAAQAAGVDADGFFVAPGLVYAKSL